MSNNTTLYVWIEHYKPKEGEPKYERWLEVERSKKSLAVEAAVRAACGKVYELRDRQVPFVRVFISKEWREPKAKADKEAFTYR